MIFISHKLNEVLEIADRITVLRRGKSRHPRRAKVRPRRASPADGWTRGLARVEKTPGELGDTLLQVAELGSRTIAGSTRRGVWLDVRAGEIVGIAGIDGNGQTELIEALTGLRKPSAGTIDTAQSAMR